MVRVNFRIEEGVKNEQILQFFKDIGYEHIGTKENSVKVEDDYITTEYFVRKTETGRYHIHLTFGKIYSGTELYPQSKFFTHYDLYKEIEGKKRQLIEENKQRNMDEINRIEKKLVETGLGFLKEKKEKCAHATLWIDYQARILKIVKREVKGIFVPPNLPDLRKKVSTTELESIIQNAEKRFSVVSEQIALGHDPSKLSRKSRKKKEKEGVRRD